ncbi:MAG: hypothetical protein KDA78_07005 [Planctomycetaceae bacterium]|nr:hypothetical protein [Planctomycetaceae bacterium]
MYELPSAQLIDALTRSTTCRERDVLRCRTVVRRLSQDLPVFDSTWIDALVQSGKLSPFQAEMLQAGRSDQLRLADMLLIDLLSNEQYHRCYLARSANRQQFFRVEEFPEDQIPAAQAVTRLLEAAYHPGLEKPAPQYLARETSLYVITPFQQGLTARDLLIRQGRFTPEFLSLVAGFLRERLSQYARTGFVHGDIRPGNLFLGCSGSLFLLNGGVRPEAQPRWTLQTRLPFESYDHFAPEILHTGKWTHESDLYAAGCLLWQLACGRPAWFSVDPLFKINAHVEQRIPDVRELAPETDEQTTRLISQWTSPDPRLRTVSTTPQRSASARSLTSPQLISRSVRQHAIARNSFPISRHDQAKTVALGSSAAVCLAFLMWQAVGVVAASSWTEWKTIPVISSLNRQTSTPAELKEDPDQLRPLPAPQEDGTLVLEPGIRYRADDVSVVGPLLVSVQKPVETEGQPAPGLLKAEVVVTGSPWRLWGTDIRLQDILITNENPGSTAASGKKRAGETESPALCVCQSMNLHVERTVFRHSADKDSQNQPGENEVKGIAWRPIARMEPHQGVIRFVNCHFSQATTGLYIAGESRQIRFENCLMTGPHELVRFAENQKSSTLPGITLDQTTVRDAQSVVLVDLPVIPEQTSVKLDLDVTNCVFDLNEAQASLVRFLSPDDPSRSIQSINVLGQNALLGKNNALVSWTRSRQYPARVIATEGIVEGLLSYEIQFPGAAESRPEASELTSYDGPRWNSLAPGVQTAEWQVETENLFR